MRKKRKAETFETLTEKRNAALAELKEVRPRPLAGNGPGLLNPSPHCTIRYPFPT